MRIVDPELVVHVFAPLTGERAEPAYTEARRIWLNCRLQLQMCNPVPELPQHLPAAVADLPSSPEIVLAAQERTGADFQAVARRVNDMLNLSVILSQRDPSRLDWSELINNWFTVATPWPPGDLLTGTHLYQAKISGGTPREIDALVAAQLTSGLPFELPDRWWEGGDEIGDGPVAYRPAGRDNPQSMLVLAAAERFAELNAWTWSDGSAALPGVGRALIQGVPPASAPRPATGVPLASGPVDETAHRVLVCTSDPQVRERMHAFLREIGLKPIERHECVQATHRLMPTTRETMLAGLRLAEVTVVVLTPDEMTGSGTMHPHQDLIFEAGLAMAFAERQTIFVVAGRPELPSGMGDGCIRLDDTPGTRQALVGRLTLAGCAPDTSGSTWLAPGVFGGLDAYTRRAA
ncbi:MAG: CATRA conflict system CASPASE/TPR repeat-associated protein [Actinomycetota bacterium]|nr:CATRA conflict system CASPASE/TPR repeat-associated protein [Actinomycetota bacterium]